MKYYIIAGEASGDLHGANLVRALVAQDPSADIRFWGGDAMAEAGRGRAVLVKHYRDLAYMGFWEVLTHLRIILGNMAFCRKDVAAFKPDAVILIDYPGFNLRVAKHLFKQGYKIYYYIAPQIWAWHTSRVKQIRRYIRRVYPVLPFEPAFYAKHGVEATFLGHPLLVPFLVSSWKKTLEIFLKNFFTHFAKFFRFCRVASTEYIRPRAYSIHLLGKFS